MVGSTQVNFSAIPAALATQALRTAKLRAHAPPPAFANPAATISTDNLRSTLAYLDAQTAANQRGMAIADTADATLGSVNELLSQAKTLALANANDAGLSAEEKSANTIMMQSALSAIDHLAAAAKFGDTKLFDGNYKLAASGASMDISRVSVEALSLAALKSGQESDPAAAIDGAIRTIATMRGKIGGFSQTTLQSQLKVATSSRIEITSAVAMLAETEQAFKLSGEMRVQFLSAPAQHSKIASHSAANVLWLIRV